MIKTPPKTGGDPRIGVALGGGGARGFAHIHVIEAMVEMGLRPSVLSGTSIGAVIAAGFATGIDARDMIDYATRLVGSHKQALKMLITKRPLGVLELFDIKKRGGAILKGEAVLELALPELLQHSFCTLTYPTKVVVTDFFAKKQKVFDRGPLMPALAASIALPSLLSPVNIGGRYYVDGGMTNPLPYEIIAEEADIVIACDVTGVRAASTEEPPSTTEILFGSIQITLHALVEAKLAVTQPQILIQPPIEDFRVLDFFKLHEILDATRPIKDEVKRKLDVALKAYSA